jgi:hypothetical protein
MFATANVVAGVFECIKPVILSRHGSDVSKNPTNEVRSFLNGILRYDEMTRWERFRSFAFVSAQDDGTRIARWDSSAALHSAQNDTVVR